MYSFLKIVTLVLISYNTTAITGSKRVGVQIEKPYGVLRKEIFFIHFNSVKKNSKLNPIESP